MANSPIRRVVTGTGPDGQSRFVSDSQVDGQTIAMMPGAGFTRIWGDDDRPKLPNSGEEPANRTWFPPATGYRVEQITIPPDSTPPTPNLDLKAAMAEMDEKVPGLAGRLDPDHPGMHQTDTIDIVYVVSGRCVVELDSGDTCELGKGDILVQNGTRHAWRVPFDEPCTVLSFSLGAGRLPGSG